MKRWIAEGAKFDGADKAATLASLVPKTAQPDPPEAYRVPMADDRRGLPPRWQGAGRRRLSRDHDLGPGEGDAVATHQERGRADLCVGLQQGRQATGGGQRKPRPVGRSETVRSRKGRRAKELGTMSRRRPIGRGFQSGGDEGRRLRRGPLDSHLRRGQRQGRAVDRRSRRLGDGDCLEQRRHAIGFGQPRQDLQGLRRRPTANH